MTEIVNDNEMLVFMGNRVKAQVKAIKTYRLVLNTGHHLDLFQTFYMHELSRNVVPLFKLDLEGIVLNLGMNVSVYLNVIVLLVLVCFVMCYIN